MFTDVFEQNVENILPWEVNELKRQPSVTKEGKKFSV